MRRVPSHISKPDFERFITPHKYLCDCRTLWVRAEQAVIVQLKQLIPLKDCELARWITQAVGKFFGYTRLLESQSRTHEYG